MTQEKLPPQGILDKLRAQGWDEEEIAATYGVPVSALPKIPKKKKRSRWQLTLLTDFYARGVPKDQAEMIYDHIKDRVERVIREEVSRLDDVVAGPYLTFRFGRVHMDTEPTKEQTEDAAEMMGEIVGEFWRNAERKKGEGNDQA